jgi:hypothetical protein
MLNVILFNISMIIVIVLSVVAPSWWDRPYLLLDFNYLAWKRKTPAFEIVMPSDSSLVVQKDFSISRVA